jgi:hypothetical protein
MWSTIREAIKSNGATIRFLVIVIVLAAAAVISWRALGPAAPEFFRKVARISAD